MRAVLGCSRSLRVYAAVTCCIVFATTLYWRQYHVRPGSDYRLYSGLHTALSLTASAMEQAPANSCVPPTDCSHSRQLLIELIGHSRARQVFEALVSLTSSSYLQRHQVAPGQFGEQPMPGPGWGHLYGTNSTCLGVWPKPGKLHTNPPTGFGGGGGTGGGGGRSHLAWCSRAAASDDQRVQLRYHWRHSLHSFREAVGSATAAASCSCPNSCVKVVVFTQGLHLLATVPGDWSVPLLLRQEYDQIAKHLATLPGAGGGTCQLRTVWMPEAAGNALAGYHSLADDTAATNALLLELLARHLSGRAATRVSVWTALLADSAALWAGVCGAPATQKWRTFCRDETYHVDADTANRMAQQLLNYACAND